MAEADGTSSLEDYSLLDLHMVATKALAEGDAYARGLLRDQLMKEEFDLNCGGT